MTYAAPRPLSSAALAAYAAPNLAYAALYFPVFIFLAPYYAGLGLPIEALGAVLVATRLVDAVTDPAMGVLSDRWSPRLGRRKIWLVLSTPVVLLSVWMAMVPPTDATVLYFAVWTGMLSLAWTAALTPYQAWGGELRTDYAGRARVTAWREGAFLIGTLGAAVLYAVGAGEGGPGEGLRAVALAVVLLLPPAAVWAFWATPEPEDRSVRRASWRAGRAAIRANAPFRRTLLAQFVNSAANALPAALFSFYVTAVLGADAEMAGLLLVAYFLAAVVSIPLWSWAARRWSKHRAWGVAMLFACAIFAVVPFLGAGDVAAFLVICVLTGVAFGADISLPPAIQADVVDVDTAEAGEQRTGLYFAFWSVATKAAAVSAGVGVAVLGVAGFSVGGDNSAAALWTLTMLYAAVPIVLKLISVALMWRFPLDAAAQEALRRRIEAQSRPTDADQSAAALEEAYGRSTEATRIV